MNRRDFLGRAAAALGITALAGNVGADAGIEAALDARFGIESTEEGALQIRSVTAGNGIAVPECSVTLYADGVALQGSGASVIWTDDNELWLRDVIPADEWVNITLVNEGV